MLSDQELLTIIEAEEKRALGWGSGELNYEREVALRFYNGEPYGNEVEGRSQIVTTEVSDTVEWILPALLKIFTASDKAVEFEPETAKDLEGAKQATDACNYVFYKQNNGFLALYTFFKDALIQKNGYVKVWYEKSERKRKEMYQGLTDEQMVMLTQDKAVTVIAHSAYPADMGGMAEAQPLMLHDVQIEITEPYGKVCVMPVPPEEMLVSESTTTVDLQKASFVAHRSRKTISELKEMGYDTTELEKFSDDSEVEMSGEWQARRQFAEDELSTKSENLDESQRIVWVTEAYMLVDYDQDGVAERRKICKSGSVVLENEEADVVPFAAITPMVNTHRHFGRSVADMVMDLQLIKSTLMRQVLDNVYLTNMPRMAVLSGSDGNVQANLDDLLNVRPGGVVREYVSGAVRPLEVPFMAQYGLQAMEYMDNVGSRRTGVTENLAGIDANSLNKTARGATILQSNAMARIELIARIFAETGVKSLFKLIQHCLATYHGRELVIRLRDEFVPVDPRQWNTEWDMTVNVGLGTGDKDQQLVHLQTIAAAQAEAVKAGGMGKLVTLKNIYHTQTKIVENAGFKDIESFWTDPDTIPPEEAKPSPEELQAQAEQQKDVAQFQADQQKSVAEFQANQQKMQQDREDAARQAQMDQQTEAMKAKFAQDTELKKTAMQIAGQIEIAKINAANQARSAEMQMQADAQKEAEEPEEPEENNNAVMQEILQAHGELLKVLASPKRIVRGPDGRATGVEHLS